MDQAKERLFEQLAELARTLGHAHRLALVEQLAQGERAVEGLAERTGLSLANASQHLQQLRRAGLVVSRRDGKRALYRLADGPIIDLLTALRQVAEHNMATVRDIVRSSFRRLDELEPIPRRELVRRLRQGDVVLLDVRPEDEFSHGHLPGALNIPLAQLKRRMAELPADREIVAYCRGPYCVLAFQAVAALRARGYRTRRLEDGFPEWKAAALAVETGGA